MSDQAESISVKVVLIGEPAVGKTTLRMSFIGSKMEGDYMTTLGADIAEKQLEIHSQLTLETQIWDLAGQENFKPMTKQFLQGAQGAVLVFDLTRDYTFDKLNEWLELLHEANPKMENNIPFIIVGNKADLESFIKVNDEDVYEYVEYLNRHHVYSQTDVEYIRTSAKTGYKVDQAFQRLGEIIVENFKQLGEYEEPEEVTKQIDTVLKKPDEEEEDTSKVDLEEEEEIDEDKIYEEEMKAIRGFADKDDDFQRKLEESKQPKANEEEIEKKIEQEKKIDSEEELTDEEKLMQRIRMGIDESTKEDPLTRRIQSGLATEEDKEEALMRKIREGNQDDTYSPMFSHEKKDKPVEKEPPNYKKVDFDEIEQKSTKGQDDPTDTQEDEIIDKDKQKDKKNEEAGEKQDIPSAPDPELNTE